jgi:poly(glycerol-phosphate) alpha-glucosyltransferase
MKLCEELDLSFSHKMHKEYKMDPASVFSLQSSVIFFGPAFGDDKKSLLRNADAFILPSFSEGLPMSVLEAWSYKLPVVMTPECNLPEGFAAEAAIRIETGTESIFQGLNSLFSMSASDLQAMGARGRSLVEERFTWKTVAAQMREVYDWMLGGGNVPSSVIGSRRRGS